MKAVLIQPPIHDFYISPDRLTALGLRCLIPALEAGGWEWELINLPREYPRGKSIPLPAELEYLKDFLIQGETGPLSWFQGYRRFGPEAEAIPEIVLSRSGEKPELILVSCLAWAYAAECREMIISLKKYFQDTVIIVGGPGAAVLPEYFYGEQGVNGADYIFTGEAEAGFHDTLAKLSRGEKPRGPEYLYSPDYTGEKIHSAEKNLEAVWSGRDVRGGSRYSTMLTRGCPKKCSFCSNFIIHGRRFRKTPLDKVLDSINELPRRGHLSVNFEDDNLLLARDYFLSVLDKLKNHNPDFSFTGENGLDYSLITEELLVELKSLGLEQLNLSLAVSNSDQAEKQQRFLDRRRYESVLGWAEKLNIPVITYFICGLEGDTPERTVNTLLYLAELPTATGISPYYPVPGLPGLENFDFRNLYPGLTRGSCSYPWMDTLSTVQLITAFRLARFSNLIGKKEHPAVEKELIKICVKTGGIHTLIRKNGEKIIIPVPETDIEMCEQFFSGIHQ